MGRIDANFMERLDYEYVVVLGPNTESSLVIGVSEERGPVITGTVICSTSSDLVGKPVAFHKEAVINRIWTDRAEVLEYIPKWWTNQLKSTKYNL